MKDFRFDGHKLIYHLDRVHEYLTRGDCYPLYLEISPTGRCNHRCIFCAYDYLGHPNRSLQTDRTLTLLDELAETGLRSILFAGEGEPLLHPDIAAFILRARKQGIDTGLFTNGQMLRKNLAERILPALTFVRFSFNGGSTENYAAIHSVQPEIFSLVVRRIRETVAVRNRHRLKADIGAQFVLLPENRDYLLSSVRILKECGVDYVAIKPFIQRSSQAYKLPKQFTMESLTEC
jgi:cyclic pyranopterin phosphate synthase